MKQKARNKKLILFDGYCLLCEWSVKFIIKRDSKKVFSFASLQSDSGNKILSKYSLPREYNSSVLLIENDKVYSESDAALRISKNLRGLWPVLYIFIYIPKSFRDFIYRFISKNRFKWFRKKESCYIPTKNEKKQFL